MKFCHGLYDLKEVLNVIVNFYLFIQTLLSCSLGFRFDRFNSRCSITNTDMQCDHVVTENEAQEELSAVEPDFSVPIVNLKSDVLEAESLSLLTEETYVDCLLTTLPVCFYSGVIILCLPIFSIVVFRIIVLTALCSLLRFSRRRSSMPLQQLQPIQQDYMVMAFTT